MARPRKWRKSLQPARKQSIWSCWCPGKYRNYITMAVDEYETIRLIDLEGFTQEECAEENECCSYYCSGLIPEPGRKLAESLVYGKVLIIEGGGYRIV